MQLPFSLFSRCYLPASCIALACVCNLLAARAQTAPTSQSTEIHLRNVRWQTLPPEIRSVYTGPDQRPWYVAPATTAATIADLESQIQDQWSRPAPLLTLARPVLFEKSGRTWFVSTDFRSLLAYDGKSWIETTAHIPQRGTGLFIGSCPDHARPPGSPSNADLGTIQLFPESSGVSAFDGKNWSYQPFIGAAPNTAGITPCILLPESDGTSALALQFSPPHLFRYRLGSWAPVPLPNPPQIPRTAALGPDGKLWLQTLSALTVVDLTPLTPDALPKAFEAQLNKLDTNNPATVAAAAQAIIDMGPPAEPLLRKALEQTVDAELAGLLNNILFQLGKPATRRPLTFGDVDINQSNPYILGHDAGNIYLSLTLGRATPQNLSTLMVIDAQGHTQRYPGILPRTDTTSIESNMLFRNDGKSLWYGNGSVSRHVNLQANPPTVDTVDTNYPWILAATGDDTIYLGAEPPAGPRGNLLARSLPILVYKPAAPDDRAYVSANNVDVTGAIPTLAPDGTFWALLPDHTLSQFDGQKWTSVLETQQRTLSLFPGNDGSLLTYGNKQFTLITKDEHFAATSIEDLIEQHPKSIAAAFSAPVSAKLFARTIATTFNEPNPTPGIPHEGGWSIAADNQNRIWLVINRTLSIFDSGKWTRVPWPADANSSGPSLVIPVGDGSAMYLWAWRAPAAATQPAARTEPKSYLALFENDHVQFKPLPVTTPSIQATGPNIFQDAQNNFWFTTQNLPAANSPTANAAAAPAQYTIQRIAPAGSLEPLSLPARPLLLDRSGFIWFSAVSNTCELWRDGKTVAHIQVPGSTATTTFLSDKPASVWIWTPIGLHHLTAPNATSPDYSLRSTTFPKDLETNPILTALLTPAAISEKGFLCVLPSATVPPLGLRKQSIIPLKDIP